VALFSWFQSKQDPGIDAQALRALEGRVRECEAKLPSVLIAVEDALDKLTRLYQRTRKKLEAQERREAEDGDAPPPTPQSGYRTGPHIRRW